MSNLKFKIIKINGTILHDHGQQAALTAGQCQSVIGFFFGYGIWYLYLLYPFEHDCGFFFWLFLA